MSLVAKVSRRELLAAAGLTGVAATGAWGVSELAGSPGNHEGAGRRVFAHYVPWFPLSKDGREIGSDYYATQYLTRNGEGGKFRSSAGFLRDRPLPVATLPMTDWRTRNLAHEVQVALDAGIDAFGVDIAQVNGDSMEVVRGMLAAAAPHGDAFSVFLQPDMTGLGDLSAAELASLCAEPVRSPGYTRGASGKPLVAPFAADRKPLSYWREFQQHMQTTGCECELVPILLDNGKLDDLSPLGGTIGNWGPRDVDALDEQRQFAARVHGKDLSLASPLVISDARPAQFVFGESLGLELACGLVNCAIDADSPYIFLLTWNDFAEGTAIEPSRRNGVSKLEVASWLAQWCRSGHADTQAQGCYVMRRDFALNMASTADDMRPTVWAGSHPAVDWLDVLVLGSTAIPVLTRNGLPVPLTQTRLGQTSTRFSTDQAGAGTYVLTTDSGTTTFSILSSGAGYDFSYYFYAMDEAK